MRGLYERSGFDEDRTIAAYAAAERVDEVERRSNTNGVPAADYARMLLADALKKGWLRAK